MNPLVRVVFVVIVSVPLLFSLDPVSAGVTLALEFMTLPLWSNARRLSVDRWSVITATLAAAVALSGLVTLLYGRAGGAELLTWGPVHVTQMSASLAFATTLRVAALVFPAVLVFATMDIAELADSLTQIARLPARFVWGAMAGLRLIELTSIDFRQVRFARRARGLAGGPLRALMPLMVLSLRRAESISLAMEARGFDAGEAPSRTTRTNYRTSVVSWRDTLGVVVALLIATVAIVVSLVTGEWHFVLS